MKMSIKLLTTRISKNELLFTEMGKTTGEAVLRIKLKCDTPNIYSSGNMEKGVEFRGKFVLQVKLLALLTYTWYLKPQHQMRSPRE